jgi:T5SS/PEP-CTERM-associated repeat protein
MTTINHFQFIAQIFHKPLKALAAGALALGVCLFAGEARATQYNWTNTTGAAFNDPNAWNPVGGPGGPADIANFASVNGTFDVPLTNSFANIGSFQMGASAAGQPMTVTLDFGTNTFAAFSGASSSASGFVFGQESGSTNIVYISVGTMYCTNSANSPSNARMIVGRNGPAIVNLTNGTVIAGNLVIANGTGANGSKVVVSGPNSSWSNSTTIAVGNGAGSANNSLVISNSGSMIAMSTIQLGNAGFFNSLLLDTSGQLFTRNVGSIGSSAASSNNTATVQGGALWDGGGKALFIGNSSGQKNSLTVGNNGTISNVTFVILSSAGNSLSLSGGLLRVSGGVTNTSATVSGYGTIASGVGFASGGTLSLGFGTTVGTLTISNNLALASGSTTIMKLDNSQVGSNDQVAASSITDAGTLTIITNGIASLNIGDQYQLFVGPQSGSFATINLPALDPSKLWDTSQLASAGILAVTFQPVAPGAPGLTNQLGTIGSSIIISGTVTGVPAPGVYWQFNNVNLTDGPQSDGSTNSGSATATLTISNAQTNESGSYCLIATNTVGASTNCMGLTISNGNVAPSISGLTDQTVIQGNNGTFSASVAGSPAPMIQWYQGGTPISGATGSSLILTNVQFSQDSLVYTIIANNTSGAATNSATLHVIIAPIIQTQPQSLVVTNTQSACFSVVSTNGVPSPTYQWNFNNAAIGNATNATYCIPNATPANAGTYKVQISNAAGSVLSAAATLTVDSAMAATLTPANGAVNVCYDTPLYLAFNQPPVLSGTGKVNIYNVNNTNTPVDTIDTSLGNIQSRTIGTEVFNTFPIIITSNNVAIYPHLGVLSSNQQYYVTLDAGIFTDTNSALYAGITGTNGWQFTTKPTGPASPYNVVVAADGSGDFATVQGAVDSVASNNLTHTLVNIRNGTYTEVVDTHLKNNITFRGQSRTGTIVGYANNNTLNGSTHSRMAFKIYANDLAVENMTVVNTTPQGGTQAEAIMIETGAARFILNNAQVDSRQDTILANVNSSQGYFFNTLVQGNFDYIWGGGNLFITNCEFRTIPTASSYNLSAPRTDNGPTGPWKGPDGNFSSNGFSFVNCLLSRSSGTVSNITMSDGNGSPDGLAAWINCNIDVTGGNGYVTPIAGVLSSQILWEYGNSNLNNTAAAPLGLTVLTNGDPRLVAASSATIWLNGWVPQLAPNILTNPVSLTVTASVTATFNVVATGIPAPTYQWLLNGTNYVNATSTNATLVISTPLAGDAGVYSVIVSNSAGTAISSNATLMVVGTGPTASFTATPTSGTEPLTVTFTDTSTGSPNITAFWDFGDATTTNTAGGASFTHVYLAGTYTVTLTASNAFGPNSTLVSNHLINVNTAFQAWQIQYFGSTTNAQAAAGADPLGKGMDNFEQFLAGINPTNPASALRITSVVPSGSDVVITWTTAGGHTNVVQANAGDGNGGYTTNFTDLSGLIVIAGSGDATNNYTDVGGATNSPSRYYRVRLAQ